MLKRILVVMALAATALVGTAITAASSNAASANCTSTINNSTLAAVIVPSGASCFINNSTVTGSVTVNKNASFETCNDLIKGSVNATSAYVNIDRDTEVDGSITLNKPGIALAAGEGCDNRGTSAYSSYICPNYIGGNLNIQNGPSWGNPTEVGDCGWVTIHGSFTISGNRLLVEAGDFSTGGSLVCVNNWPQPEFFPLFYVGSQIVGCPIFA
jgi:hypothetical protein